MHFRNQLVAFFRGDMLWMLAGRTFRIYSSVGICCPFPRFIRMGSWKFRRDAYVVTMNGNHIPKYLKCTHVLSFNHFFRAVFMLGKCQTTGKSKDILPCQTLFPSWLFILYHMLCCYNMWLSNPKESKHKQRWDISLNAQITCHHSFNLT